MITRRKFINRVATTLLVGAALLLLARDGVSAPSAPAEPPLSLEDQVATPVAEKFAEAAATRVAQEQAAEQAQSEEPGPHTEAVKEAFWSSPAVVRAIVQVEIAIALAGYEPQTNFTEADRAAIVLEVASQVSEAVVAQEESDALLLRELVRRTVREKLGNMAWPTPGPAPTARPTPTLTPTANPSPTPRPTATPIPTPALTPERKAYAELKPLLPWIHNPPFASAIVPFVEVWLRDPELGRDLALAPWVVDGITAPLEHNAPYGLGNLYDHDPALARRILAYSTEEPVRTPNIHLLNALGDMARDDPTSLELMQTQGWFADGLSPEERAFVVVLTKVAYNHAALYADLLEEWFTMEATVDLPLSGETFLWAFGHDPVEGNVLRGMEDGARAAERVMASPLRVTDIIMLQVNPDRYGGGPGGVHIGDSMVLSTQSGLVDTAHADLLYHEVAHYYLGHEFGPFWLVEGGADFIRTYRQAWDGTEDWDGRVPLREGNEYAGRRWCLDNGVPNVSAIAEANSELAGICSYHLGEYLLTHLYNAIGEAAFSSAMAELFRSYTRFQFYPSEEQVYRVFLKHTPPDLEETFLDVYRRFHGGPFVGGG